MATRKAQAQAAARAPSLHALPKKGAKLDVEPLDRIIHERMRLAIVSALAVNPILTFNELKDLLGMSDGNLSVHTQKLEATQYILCRKGFAGRMPRTEYELTAKGRRELERYLNHMQAIIQAVQKDK